MSWPKASVDKEALLYDLASGLECERKRMFGAPVLFAGGSMFAGVFADDIFLRLDDGERARFLKENKGAHGFEPVPGKRMNEYVVVPHTLLKNKAGLREWLSMSRDYAANIKGG